jgi:hypothetical protein
LALSRTVFPPPERGGALRERLEERLREELLEPEALEPEAREEPDARERWLDDLVRAER